MSTPSSIASALALALISATSLAAQRPPQPTRDYARLRLAAAAPTGLHVAQVGPAISVSWSPTAGASGYRVSRAPDQTSFTDLTPAPIPDTTFSDTTAAAGSTYYYRVAAQYPDGRVGTTDPVAFTVHAVLRANVLAKPVAIATTDIPRRVAVMAGPAPTNIAAAPAPTSVALSWPAMFGSGGYKVERSLPPGSGWADAGPADGQGFTDKAIDPDTPVQYRVTALYSDGRVGVSEPISTRTTKPVNPGNLKASVAPHTINAQITPTLNALSVAYANINLTWGSVPGAGYYEIQGTGLSIPKTTPQTTFGIATQPPGSAQYQVVAYFLNAAGRRFGDAASPSKLEVVVGSPWASGFGGVTYAGDGPGIVDFRWGNSNGATSFKLFRGDAEYGPFNEVTNVSWAQNWVRDYSSPARGKTYYYKLLSIFPSGTPIAWTPVVRIDIPGAISLQGLTATSPGPGTVKLSWAALANAQDYSILRGKGNEPMAWIMENGSPMRLGPFTTTYQDNNLWNGATYRYNVCARINNGSACSSTSVTLAP